MTIALYIAAGLIAALTLWDVFITVFSTVGAGPLSRLWTGPLWRVLLLIHHRRPIHRVLTLTGPFALIAGIVLWYLLVGLALFLVVLAAPGSVVDGNTKEPPSSGTSGGPTDSGHEVLRAGLSLRAGATRCRPVVSALQGRWTSGGGRA